MRLLFFILIVLTVWSATDRPKPIVPVAVEINQPVTRTTIPGRAKFSPAARLLVQELDSLIQHNPPCRCEITLTKTRTED